MNICEGNYIKAVDKQGAVIEGLLYKINIDTDKDNHEKYHTTLYIASENKDEGREQVGIWLEELQSVEILEKKKKPLIEGFIEEINQDNTEKVNKIEISPEPIRKEQWIILFMHNNGVGGAIELFNISGEQLELGLNYCNEHNIKIVFKKK